MRNIELGQSVRSRRKDKGLTLAKLSELTGVNTAYLGRIETGKRFPSAGVLQKMGPHLGYGEAEFLKLAGYLSPDQTDERVTKMKESMRGEIETAMSSLLEKVETL